MCISGAWACMCTWQLGHTCVNGAWGHMHKWGLGTRAPGEGILRVLGGDMWGEVCLSVAQPKGALTRELPSGHSCFWASNLGLLAVPHLDNKLKCPGSDTAVPVSAGEPEREHSRADHQSLFLAGLSWTLCPHLCSLQLTSLKLSSLSCAFSSGLPQLCSLQLCYLSQAPSALLSTAVGVAPEYPRSNMEVAQNGTEAIRAVAFSTYTT